MDTGVGPLDPLHIAREILMRDPLGTGEQVFDHRGPIDAGLVQHLLEIAEDRSRQVGDHISLRKRLCNVLVEGLENIHRHAEREYNASAGVALYITNEGYLVLLGNGMPIMKATMMEHRIELLNVMDGDDLKDHYLKVLANEGRTENGGAGLGLMTMARKSTRPISFRTRTVNELTVYGVLELRVASVVQ